jgi:hypothetical protein
VATTEDNIKKVFELHTLFAVFGVQIHVHPIGLKLSLKENPPISLEKGIKYSWPYVDIWKLQVGELIRLKSPPRVFKKETIFPTKRSLNEGILMKSPQNYMNWIKVILNTYSLIQGLFWL